MERISSKFVHILLLSEHLRARLHCERNPDMIKDRRYHLRMYQCCFVGKEVVDWLLKLGEAPSRFSAVQCMCALQESNLLHHGKILVNQRIVVNFSRPKFSVVNSLNSICCSTKIIIENLPTLLKTIFKKTIGFIILFYF